jgi:hypothetical protein
MAFLQPGDIVSGFDTAVDILSQRSLIAFERDNVISLFFDDFLGDISLTPHRVNGDDGAVDRQHVEQGRNGHDLVGFFRHRDLSEHEALTRGESGKHVDRLFRTPLLVRAAQCLAINGDDLGRRLGQLCDPGDEAALEGLRIERGENITQSCTGVPSR